MAELIDESDDFDMEAEWAESVVRSGNNPRKKRVSEKRRGCRKRIEEMQEQKRLKDLLDDYDYDGFDSTQGLM